MITWKIITDDFGNEIIVTDINYPNPMYFSRYVGQFYGLYSNKSKSKKS